MLLFCHLSRILAWSMVSTTLILPTLGHALPRFMLHVLTRNAIQSAEVGRSTSGECNDISSCAGSCIKINPITNCTVMKLMETLTGTIDCLLSWSSYLVNVAIYNLNPRFFIPIIDQSSCVISCDSISLSHKTCMVSILCHHPSE